MKYIKAYKTFENNLTYDEMDLTGFDHKFIVGRWFANEEEAMGYLKKSAEEYEQLSKVSDDVLPPGQILK